MLSATSTRKIKQKSNKKTGQDIRPSVKVKNFLQNGDTPFIQNPKIRLTAKILPSRE